MNDKGIAKRIMYFGFIYQIYIHAQLYFMPPLRSSQRHYVFGLSVRPSVRTSRSCDRVISRTDFISFNFIFIFSFHLI